MKRQKSRGFDHLLWQYKESERDEGGGCSIHLDSADCLLIEEVIQHIFTGSVFLIRLDTRGM